ncbi:MAG: hypothetical protein ABS46_08045 [Cytophagaceae bacterium SCN 52-12]|nr:MAG: hypothetical protein ABS46_08045 [Cytophagaceae bacterium SCN 52-12]
MPFRTLLSILAILYTLSVYSQPAPRHHLRFDKLAQVWDEAIPLGNGTLGALVWEKEKVLRLSLDRADIWDLRPMKGLHRPEFSFEWVRSKVLENDYKPVQENFDAPYDREPAPSKIPAGALEFTIPSNTGITSVELIPEKALCLVKWDNGMKLTTFVHATEPEGWFRFENTPSEVLPELIPPAYQGKPAEGSQPNSLVGDDLARLGYKPGVVQKKTGEITYEQEGWGGFVYRVAVSWKRINKTTIEGAWSISSHYPDREAQTAAGEVAAQAIKTGFNTRLESHEAWWKSFWAASSVRIPDQLLEKQWYLEQYKFGSTARKNAPPISLQAVWTADNGRIPPWKGDFHHDLNTQLSYWPAYSGNHLAEAMGYLHHLDANKPNYKRYTKQYFGAEGLAVPGVTTLDGTEMGGWIQYSLSPTVSAWLAQHYYLQWKYGMDRDFLRESAYPWFREVCTFLEHITAKDENGLRQLPLSSSPEINDNRISAWFLRNTNYDLSLMKFAFGAAAELAGELDMKEDAARWEKILGEFGDYSLTEKSELMFAPGFPYSESHRHFSHLMAIHPLGLIRWEDGEKSQKIIKNTLAQLEAIGPAYWCGYSYSWLGNLYARAKNGPKAAGALRIFAGAFCLPNSFHANGDQTKSGYSTMTYRPFTLEGNMAFAAGIQEMLLQSYAGFIEIMPAIPGEWKNVSFENLRAEGAFLVSAQKKNGHIETVRISAEKGGDTSLLLPFEQWEIVARKGMETGKADDGKLVLRSSPGGYIVLRNKK